MSLTVTSMVISVAWAFPSCSKGTSHSLFSLPTSIDGPSHQHCLQLAYQQVSRNDTFWLGAPSNGTCDTQNWQNNNVKPRGLDCHTGSIPYLATLLPVPAGPTAT